MLKAVIFLIIAMVSIQFAASAAKQLFPVLGVAGTASLRLFFAASMMAAVMRPWKYRPTRNILLYGVSLGLMNLSFYFALKRIPLGIGVALEFLGPLSVAIFSSRKKVDYVWALLAGLGILLLLPQTSTSGLDPIGVFLAVLAGVFWALYIVFGKKAGREIPGGVAASLGMLVAAAVVLPVGVALDGTSLLTLSALPMAIFVAFFGSAFPYSLEMIALKEMPAQTFGVLMSLEPAVAAIAGLLVLGELLSMNQWLAVGCVIVSSLGSTITNKK